MSVERTISARRVELKAAAPSPTLSAVATAPRTVTLHERFSQLPKVEPKKEERRAPTVVDLNLFQEVGVTARRQATEQRQGTKREAVVAERRSIATTWTPSFDNDDDSAPRINVHNAGRRGRQFEFDQPRETAFVIKGIPPPQPRQRTVATSAHHHQQTTSRSGNARSIRGGRIVDAMPATRGGGVRQAAGNQRPVNGRGGPGGVARGGRGGGRGGAVPSAGATRGGGRGGARGGRGGGATRGGRTDAAAKPKSKDALDAELDSYMLQTPESAKNYLDQQLEDYMHAREQESSSSSS